MQPLPSTITIVPFQPSLATHFASLNRQWLQQHFTVEPLDEAMLDDPQSFFIDKGGHVLFACAGEAVVGTVALLKGADGVYELSKMAVDKDFRDQKIGHLLLRAAIDKAQSLKARKLELYSSTKLAPAIHLYHKFGFQFIPVGDSLYKRSDIRMELILTEL